MAVVKLKYLKDRAHLKRHLRYITYRRGREGGSLTRTLFGSEGLTDKHAVYTLIDAARRGTVFYKFMINPDPAKEDAYKDVDLEHMTRQTILALERKLGLTLPFAAVLHPADHSALRHVHGIFLLPKRLSKEAFRTLWQLAWTTATAQARLQRRARDKVLSYLRYQSLSFSRIRIRSPSQRSQRIRSKPHGRQPLPRKQWGRGYRPRFQRGCPRCGFGRISGLSAFLAVCPTCCRRLTKERIPQMTREVML